MKKILSSSILIGIVALTAFGISSAFFSDTETSQDNTFQAGKLDLKVNNTSFYNGSESPDTTWLSNDLMDQLFFDFDDVKPGDFGEDTISLLVDDNDAWMCMNIEITSNDDNLTNNSEVDDGDSQDDLGFDFDGELAQNLHFIFWTDDGDNVLEDDEDENIFIDNISLIEISALYAFSLADITTNVWTGNPGDTFPGAVTQYIGKAWCFGELTLNPVAQGVNNDPTIDSGVSCNGINLDNITQTDSVLGDITFTAVQSRNNPGFKCPKPLFIESLEVDAQGAIAESSNVLENGKTYRLKASGTANAGDSIDFDAEYSLTNNVLGDTWSDDVTNYEVYGPNLLDLKVDGSFVNWGGFNPTHEYWMDIIGDGTTITFEIYDIFPPNNTGSLFVDIYELP